MSESRRGRRPPLPPSNVPHVTPIESADVAPSTLSDSDQAPLAAVDVEQIEAPGKGAVYNMHVY
jgi:hypothetical protein